MRLTPVERLALLDEPDRLYALRRLSMPEKRGLIANHWWHEGQSVPDGDWRIGLILAPARVLPKPRPARIRPIRQSPSGTDWPSCHQ